MSGIACAGNWVLDRNKFIDYYPDINGHTTVHRSIPCPGGGALNILMALTRLKAPFPTYGIGIIGTTMRAKELARICRENHINMDYVKAIDGQSSFTDAMILPDGSRTQFHCPGVNGLLGPKHIPIDKLQQQQVKLLYLGHLMILDAMDAPDPDYGRQSARVLHQAQLAGMQTAIDIVSNPSLDYQKLVGPALPYTDYIICNAFEAAQLTKIKLKDDDKPLPSAALHQAAEQLLQRGVKKAVIIHTPTMVYALLATGKRYLQPSLTLPKDRIIASCGAGDAFCAGVLYGIHENWPMEQALKLGVCTAGASLTTATNTSGIKPWQETLALADSWL